MELSNPKIFEYQKSFLEYLQNKRTVMNDLSRFS